MIYHEDGCGCRHEDLVGDFDERVRYFLQADREPEREVTRHEWMAAEEAADLHPAFPGHPATAGFAADKEGHHIEGRTEHIMGGRP